MNKTLILIPFFLSSLFNLSLFPQESQAQIIDDAYAHYQMEENAPNTTVGDAGTGGNDGVATVNTDVLSVPGVINQAFDFQNQYRVQVTDLGNQVKNDLVGTVAVWAKRSVATPSNLLFSLGASGADTHFVFRIEPGGRLDAIAQLNGPRVVRVTGTTGLPVGVWAHCVIVQDGVQMRLYINGVEENTVVSDDPGAWIADANASGQLDRFFIGGTNSLGTGSNFFPGALDDFRYYKRALSSDDIEALYNSGVVPAYTCNGFEPPLDDNLTVKKKNRVLPFKMTLLDENGDPITDAHITAAPVLEVDFQASQPGDTFAEELLPAGQGDDGNQFVFSGDKWHFNAKTKNFTAPGTYTFTTISGDDAEYVINPACTAMVEITEG